MVLKVSEHLTDSRTINVILRGNLCAIVYIRSFNIEGYVQSIRYWIFSINPMSPPAFELDRVNSQRYLISILYRACLGPSDCKRIILKWFSLAPSLFWLCSNKRTASIIQNTLKILIIWKLWSSHMHSTCSLYGARFYLQTIIVFLKNLSKHHRKFYSTYNCIHKTLVIE